MDYGRVIPVVEYLADTVTRLLTDGLEEDRSKPARPDGSVRRRYHLGEVFLGLFLLATGVLVALVLPGTS